jgi:hypothetical protein
MTEHQSRYYTKHYKENVQEKDEYYDESNE